MATQHPDNAKEAYFLGKKFVNILDEIEECYRMYDELKCTEYMWDWEGKFVDEAVIEKLYQRYYDFFKKNQLGKDVFLTFRIPNTDEESGYRLARAFMAMLTADDIAQEVGMHGMSDALWLDSSEAGRQRLGENLSAKDSRGFLRAVADKQVFVDPLDLEVAQKFFQIAWHRCLRARACNSSREAGGR